MAKQKILIGLSGGVDSALSAALLVEAGHEVHGVYLKAWDSAVSRQPSAISETRLPFTGSCPWKDDIADARRVAAHLGIPFTVIDVHEAYRKRVVDVMLAEYAAGRTPNPDILCNREMKFGLLLDLAKELGYHAVATGHYAQVLAPPPPRESPAATPEEIPAPELHRGRDEKKDQTYFLWTLTPEQLPMIRFPIGHLTKPEVRAEAVKRNLPVAAKKDSQGICFLGPVDVRDFLRTALKTEPGDVVDTAGRVIGTHDGAQLYTVGQRHGFRVTQLPATNYQLPTHYVVVKDVARNRLVVDTTPPMSTELSATDLNWIGEPPRVGDRLEARIRHGQQPQPAEVVSCQLSVVSLRFREPQLAISPGQSVVFSEGTRILGGGIIG